MSKKPQKIEENKQSRRIRTITDSDTARMAQKIEQWEEFVRERMEWEREEAFGNLSEIRQIRY